MCVRVPNRSSLPCLEHFVDFVAFERNSTDWWLLRPETLKRTRNWSAQTAEPLMTAIIVDDLVYFRRLFLPSSTITPPVENLQKFLHVLACHSLESSFRLLSFGRQSCWTKQWQSTTTKRIVPLSCLCQHLWGQRKQQEYQLGQLKYLNRDLHDDLALTKRG